MSTTRFALGCFGAFLAVTACGGSSGIDLFTNPDAGTGGPGAGSEGGTSSSSSSGGSSGSDGGKQEPTPDGGTRPGGDTTSIPCGSASCTLANEVCCVTNGGGTQSFACHAGATCPTQGGGGGDNPNVALKCTGAANCGPGTVCCVSQTDLGTTASCAASCTGDQAQLCDPSASNTGCSASQPCSSDNIRDWRLPRTFGTCGGKGD